jgi:hypothetical protein
MKTNFLSLILIGSLVLNVANAVAQDEIVTAQAPFEYQNGVEKIIGAAVPRVSDTLQFLNVGFFAPADYPFTNASLSLYVNVDGSTVGGPYDDIYYLTLTEVRKYVNRKLF